MLVRSKGRNDMCGPCQPSAVHAQRVRSPHRGKLGNTPDVVERVVSHRGGLSALKRFSGGKTTIFRRRWNFGGRQWPPVGSVARGGEGESEGQHDWRQEAHGGELTKAVTMATMAASRPATPACLRRSVQTRCKGGGDSVELVCSPVGKETK
jgi:hypothetical protein